MMLDETKTGLLLRISALQRYAEDLDVEACRTGSEWVKAELRKVQARIQELLREAA